MESYDLVVIGGGPSGFAAAMRALDFGKRVLLIEKKGLGGAEVFNGVMTSKTLWEYSKKVRLFREVIPGYVCKFEDSDKEVRDAVRLRRLLISEHVRLLMEKSERHLFHLERGKASLVTRNEVKIHRTGAPDLTVWGDQILICTGSRPRYLPHIPIDEKIIMTSDGIRHLKDFPKSLVILGAGVIGCEFATIFTDLGNTKVMLIDKADRILPFEDEDVAAMVSENLEKNGAVIHHGASLLRMEILDGEVEYELQYKNGDSEVIRVEKALVSVGRQANIEDLGLETLGIRLNDRGGIWTEDTQTNISNVYAAGDVSSGISLVNVGEREARHAVERMFGNPGRALNNDNVSTIMFLNPEVATVGLNEQECRKKGMPFKVVKMDYSLLPRAIAMHKTRGFFKILVTNDQSMRILGMRAVGAHASSAIEAVAYLIHTGQGIRELAGMIHPHPSIIEGVQESLRMLLGESILKPQVFQDKLTCYLCENGQTIPVKSLF